jgi:hypothetical protein
MLLCHPPTFALGFPRTVSSSLTELLRSVVFEPLLQRSKEWAWLFASRLTTYGGRG